MRLLGYVVVLYVMPREFPHSPVTFDSPTRLSEASGEDCRVHPALMEVARDEILGSRIINGGDCPKSWRAKLL